MVSWLVPLTHLVSCWILNSRLRASKERSFGVCREHLHRKRCLPDTSGSASRWAKGCFKALWLYFCPRYEDEDAIPNHQRPTYNPKTTKTTKMSSAPLMTPDPCHGALNTQAIFQGLPSDTGRCSREMAFSFRCATAKRIGGFKNRYYP